MKIQIFDVEHGGCALVTADTGARILIDCGHNSSTNFRPSTYLRNLGLIYLERLIITNYDEDHASDLANLLNVVSIGTLASNPSVSGDDIFHLKSIGGIGKGIEALANLKKSYTASAGSTGPDFGNITFKYFWNKYKADFEDENNLSLVTIIKANNLSICFPGDMEVEGWKNLLKRPDFVDAIGSVDIMVASHHGRRNGCCEELYENSALNPQVTIISDSGIQYASQETISWYRQRTRGIRLNGEQRSVITTRRDGRILIESIAAGNTLSTGA